MTPPPKPDIFVPGILRKTTPVQFTVLLSVEGPMALSTDLTSQEAFVHGLTCGV